MDTSARSLAAAAALLAAAMLGGCAAGGTGLETMDAERAASASLSAPPSGWLRVDDAPLTPRDEPTRVWTGTEVLVVGGYDGPPCPPTADCEPGDPLSDGARLDPATGTWRAMTPAPAASFTGQSAVVDGQVFFTGVSGDSVILQSYDPETDTWHTWAVPEGARTALEATADGVVLYSGSDEWGVAADLLLDPTTGAWTELPEDPLGPSFDRVLTNTADGLFLTAAELVASPGSESPSLTRVARLDPATQTWTRLADTEQLGAWRWAVYDNRMIAPVVGGADGGEVNNWGREYPFGGSITLPSGDWNPLIGTPPQRDGYAAGVTSTLGERYSVTSGYVFDAADDTWTPITLPEEAGDFADLPVWAGERLVVVMPTSTASGEWMPTRSAETWIFTP